MSSPGPSPHGVDDGSVFTAAVTPNSLNLRRTGVDLQKSPEGDGNVGTVTAQLRRAGSRIDRAWSTESIFDGDAVDLDSEARAADETAALLF